MKTAKLFQNGQSQAVRLPKEYRFEGEEVYLKKMGRVVILYPKDKAWEVFLEGLEGFSDDFLPQGRPPQGEQQTRGVELP